MQWGYLVTKRDLGLIKRRIFYRFNPLYVPYYPKYLHIEVSSRCNLRCSRCERTAVPTNFLGHITPLEMIERISPIFPYILGVSIIGGLGEPFLNPHLWVIIKFIKSFDIHVAYTTNGLLLDEENIKKTLEVGVDKVVISLDSATEEVYNKIRQGGSFNQVVENIKKFCEMKKLYQSKLPCICLSLTIQKSNIEEMPAIVELAHQLVGVNEVWFSGFIAHNRETLTESPYFLTPEYASEIFMRTRRVASKLNIPIRIPKLWNKELFKEKVLCTRPWNAMFIFYNSNAGIGDVGFCEHFRTSKKYYFCVVEGTLIQQEVNYPSGIIGNVFKESILKIWNSQTYRALRKDLKFGPTKPPCNTCWARFGIH